jgi:hypothetical protein
MSEPGFASLGPTLLARKGGAKPAMRPQLAPLVTDESQIAAMADDQLEDLGWNDMGHDESGEHDNESGAEVVPINAAVAASESAAAHNPIVRRQQRNLEDRVLADAVMAGPEGDDGDVLVGIEQAASYDLAADEYGETEEYDEDGTAAQDYAPLAPAAPAPVAPAPAPRMTARRAPRLLARVPERRAAFTLRLDPERHLKLRLAATMQGVSAQVLLTEALDAMLAEFDDLDLIAAHLKRH